MRSVMADTLSCARNPRAQQLRRPRRPVRRRKVRICPMRRAGSLRGLAYNVLEIRPHRERDNMSSKQSLRLPIDLAKRLNAYLRAASALAARGRLDPTSTGLQDRWEAFERLLALSEPNADTPRAEAANPECAEDPGRQPAPAPVSNGGVDRCR